ncbi:MAG TPA: MarP family serine protease [Solirubrobacteraceae bacterium]|nr:MarP family serine protease [Solirubrobacteraceae bacterium]
MTGIDWVILGAVVLLALFGWAQGFVSGVLALIGFAAGAWLGTRVAPLVLEGGRESTWAPAFALVGAIVAGGILAAGFEGVGARLRSRLSSPAFAAIDGALGAILTACVGLLVAWVLGAVALQAGPDIRRDVQRSTILRQLNAVLPPTGPLLNTLRALDPFPRIDGPEARVPPPRAAIARDPEVAAARDSVVKILGTACGVGVEGSGWVAEPGVVVTNAHVVAGQEDTRVLPEGREPGLPADAIAFDTRNDLAVLRVPGLDAPRLEIAGDPEAGTSAAILGFPLNGPYDVRAGRVGQTREVVSQDAYGRGPVRRTIVSLRGAVRSGNSGGPMVDGAGRVVTTIFAATTSGPRGGYGVPNAVVRDALAGAGGPVSTGPCGG